MTATASSKAVPCPWFAGEAAEVCAPLLSGPRAGRARRNPADGAVLLIEFAFAGQRFVALNGGVRSQHTDAVSFPMDRADQAEVDRLWGAPLARGG